MDGPRATPRRRRERAVTLHGGHVLTQFDEGRRCSHPECRAVLSRYNPNDACAAHGGWQEQREARRRRA